MFAVKVSGAAQWGSGAAGQLPGRFPRLNTARSCDRRYTRQSRITSQVIIVD